MSRQGSNGAEDDRSEFGDVFSGPEVRGAYTAASAGGKVAGSPPARVAGAVPAEHGIVRETPTEIRGWGKGPIVRDPRKFRYDGTRARTMAPVPFSASKADRLDARIAGDLLHKIHVMYGIDKEEESRILAFDNAMWFEHAINGASLLQPGGGTLTVGNMSFDVAPIKEVLGVNQRRFYRAYADDIAANNKEILDAYDAYDPESVEKVGQLRQVAIERGLQKFPHLAHDSSDACLSISMEERLAIGQSKRIVMPTVNQVDALPEARSAGEARGKRD